MILEKITAEHLRRKAIVYVRQSSPGQVIQNRESQRLQRDLARRAGELGFRQVEVVDEDLGRTASGLVDRSGFERLLGEVCSGGVGAVFSTEMSRLARNGREWHHLLDMCGVLGAVLVDLQGVYDPRLSNDRLFLGLRGSMSEFELALIRQRSFEAIRAKAGRGELAFCLPVGFCWHHGRIELDPDRRVQEGIRSVFRKFVEVGSVRQVLLWFRREKVTLPQLRREAGEWRLFWELPRYKTVLRLLTNPIYGGAYAFGRTEARTSIVDGKLHRTDGHRKAMSDWTVLIRDHHPSYITWEEYERNQAVVAENANMKKRMGRGSGRGGRSLLAGLLRCRRCGRMLHIAYTGNKNEAPRYHCRGAHINHGESWCISFGGWRVDQAVAAEVLRAVEGPAIEAALEAAERSAHEEDDHRRALTLELEQARYEARLAERRYEVVDPEQRLVAAELEARWNAALHRVVETEQRVQNLESEVRSRPVAYSETLLQLATDLPSVWDAPNTSMRLKQRIMKIVIEEIVADVDEKTNEVVLVIHWSGGRHSELRVRKNKTGHHRRCTDSGTVDVVRQMAGRFTDEQIASTLNRAGLRTGAGNTWNEGRVRSLRSYLQLPAYDPAVREAMLTLEQTAKQLSVSASVVRRLIALKILPARQIVSWAPWEIQACDVENETVRASARAMQARRFKPPSGMVDDRTLTIPGL
jgi:DNA invertase Pin-like site-specific DNA recombinase